MLRIKGIVWSSFDRTRERIVGKRVESLDEILQSRFTETSGAVVQAGLTGRPDSGLLGTEALDLFEDLSKFRLRGLFGGLEAGVFLVQALNVRY